MDTRQDPTPQPRPRKALSLRQREFALRLARGVPAVKAAIEAGYAPSTAQSNAQRLMRNPLVIGYFDTIRKNRIYINPRTTTKVLTTLFKLLLMDTHPTVQLRAAELLLAFRKRQHPANSDIYLTEAEQQQYCGNTPTDPDIYATFMRLNKLHLLDNQIIDSIDIREFFSDDIAAQNAPVPDAPPVDQPLPYTPPAPKIDLGTESDMYPVLDEDIGPEPEPATEPPSPIPAKPTPKPAIYTSYNKPRRTPGS